MQYTLKKIFRYIRMKDIGALFVCILIAPFALVAKLFIRNFWLVCEECNEARDNGYWFFKWVRENRPGQRIAYAVSKKSPDYPKVRPLGKVIGYGTPAHWFWYIIADKNISSQKGGKPNAAVCYFFEVVLRLRKKNRVFLQHGVTINRGTWLFYPNTYFDMFITAAKPEHDYVSEHFGYPTGKVKLLGFSRFDKLHGAEADDGLLLVMPSWRNWLGRESRDNKALDFQLTEYYRKWQAFLNDERLAALLKRYDKRLIFYPHRNMQKFLYSFSSRDGRIVIADWHEYDVQELLKKATLLITDYSSVFFDFSYMGKPVLFYQFDEAEFREKQYAQGYFDYRNTVLGVWSKDADELFAHLSDALQAGCPGLSEEEIRTFFPLYDTQNSRRIYDAIKAAEKNKRGQADK